MNLPSWYFTIFIASVSVYGSSCRQRETSTVKAGEELTGLRYDLSDLISGLDALKATRDQDHKDVNLEDALSIMSNDLRAAEMFRNFTIVYQSGSAQEASSENPRIIFSSDDGRLTMSINGAPTQAGYDQLEIIRTSPTTKTNSMHFIRFPYKADDKTGLVSNPSFCFKCHGSESRHFWNDYPNWPGVIGSDDDLVTSSTTALTRKIDGCDSLTVQPKAQTIEEQKLLVKFREMANANGGHPRYKHFATSAQIGTDPKSVKPYSAIPKGFFADRPNFRLGKMWHLHDVAQAAEKLNAWPSSQQAARYFLYDFAKCREVRTSNDVLNQFAVDEERWKSSYTDAATKWYATFPPGQLMMAKVIGRTGNTMRDIVPLPRHKESKVNFEGFFDGGTYTINLLAWHQVQLLKSKGEDYSNSFVEKTAGACELNRGKAFSERAAEFGVGISVQEGNRKTVCDLLASKIVPVTAPVAQNKPPVQTQTPPTNTGTPTQPKPQNPVVQKPTVTAPPPTQTVNPATRTDCGLANYKESKYMPTDISGLNVWCNFSGFPLRQKLRHISFIPDGSKFPELGLPSGPHLKFGISDRPGECTHWIKMTQDHAVHAIYQKSPKKFDAEDYSLILRLATARLGNPWNTTSCKQGGVEQP